MEYPKVYKPSLAEARAREETDLFRASHRLNIACKGAIEAAIREGFDGMHLKKECVKPVMEEYGPERVEWVLANTIRHLEYDGRFSRSNKEWAGSFPVKEGGTPGHDVSMDFIVGSHPAVLDGFINKARREMEQMKQPQQRKPSIKEQLATKPVPGDQPVKPKEREAR